MKKYQSVYKVFIEESYKKNPNSKIQALNSRWKNMTEKSRKVYKEIYDKDEELYTKSL